MKEVFIMTDKKESTTDKMRKLFAENALDVEEMERIVGGALEHSDCLADDSRFLNVLLRGRPGQCDRYGDYMVGGKIPEIQQAWASVGVTMVYDSRSRYHQINGQRVSAEEAYNYAMKVVGKQLKPSDWYWDKK